MLRMNKCGRSECLFFFFAGGGGGGEERGSSSYLSFVAIGQKKKVLYIVLINSFPYQI